MGIERRCMVSGTMCLFYHCNSFFLKTQSKINGTLHVCCVCTAQIANLETRNSEYCHRNCIYMQKCCYVSISSVGFFLHFSFCEKKCLLHLTIQWHKVCTSDKAMCGIFNIWRFLIKLVWTDAKRVGGTRRFFPDAFQY